MYKLPYYIRSSYSTILSILQFLNNMHASVWPFKFRIHVL